MRCPDCEWTDPDGMLYKQCYRCFLDEVTEKARQEEDERGQYESLLEQERFQMAMDLENEKQ